MMNPLETGKPAHHLSKWLWNHHKSQISKIRSPRCPNVLWYRLLNNVNISWWDDTALQFVNSHPYKHDFPRSVSWAVKKPKGCSIYVAGVLSPCALSGLISLISRLKRQSSKQRWDQIIRAALLGPVWGTILRHQTLSYFIDFKNPYETWWLFRTYMTQPTQLCFCSTRFTDQRDLEHRATGHALRSL